MSSKSGRRKQSTNVNDLLAPLVLFLREFGVGILIIVAAIAIVYQLVTTYTFSRRMQAKNEADRERLRNEAQADLQEIARKERAELQELRTENETQAELIDTQTNQIAALTRTNERQAGQIRELTDNFTGLQQRFEELVGLNQQKDARLAKLERELRLLKQGSQS